jgi:hypothetical protein
MPVQTAKGKGQGEGKCPLAEAQERVWSNLCERIAWRPRENFFAGKPEIGHLKSDYRSRQSPPEIGEACCLKPTIIMHISTVH